VAPGHRVSSKVSDVAITRKGRPQKRTKIRKISQKTDENGRKRPKNGRKRTKTDENQENQPKNGGFFFFTLFRNVKNAQQMAKN
jgi:hypothetical protein